MAVLSPQDGHCFSGCSMKKKARSKKKKTERWLLAACPIEAPPVKQWRLDWRDHATTLLRIYNEGLLNNPTRLREAKKGRTRVTLASSAGALEALYAVFVWARQQKINPEGWVRWNARRVKSADRPLMRLGHLFETDRVAAYLADEMVNVNEAAARDAELHRRLGSSGFIAGRDLHAGAEQAKTNFRLRAREVLCIEAVEITFGWHERSIPCSDCPQAAPCKAATVLRLAKAGDSRG